ncbi:MAG: SGNH/GDSL hydrolase family protein [Sedimenticola sp.]
MEESYVAETPDNTTFGDSSSNASTILMRDESSSEVPIDQFENVFYKTAEAENKTRLSFVSNVFFQNFLAKMKADFSSGITEADLSSGITDRECTTGVTKCVTHVNGLRCEIVMNSHDKSVTLTGEGHKVWRQWKFSKIAYSLFAKFVESADGHVDNADSQIDTADGQADPFGDSEQIPLQIPFTYDSATIGVNMSPIVAQITTSTPFPVRQNIAQNDTIVSTLLNKIDNMDKQITALRLSLNKFMDTFTHSGTNANTGPSKPSKEKHSRKNHISQEAINISDTVEAGVASGTNQRMPEPQNQRACQLGMNQPAQEEAIPVVIRNRPNRPNDEESLSSLDLTLDSQHDSNQSPQNNKTPLPKATHVEKKTLLIGDSILHGVNENGLKRGIHKRSIGGATIHTIVNELSMYDMKQFSTVIIHCGGNDASNGTDLELFEERYDQLMSVVKCGNPENKVFLCKVAPRGDIDVSRVNESIVTLANHWKSQDVQYISDTHELFYGRDGVPQARFYNHDSIHLSRSGIKRLLDSINRHVAVVQDYDQCVFQPNRRSDRDRAPGANRYGMFPQDRRYASPGHNGQYSHNSHVHTNGPSDNAPWSIYHHNRSINSSNQGRSGIRCFYCGMAGHKIADCFNK